MPSGCSTSPTPPPSSSIYAADLVSTAAGDAMTPAARDAGVVGAGDVAVLSRDAVAVAPRSSVDVRSSSSCPTGTARVHAAALVVEPPGLARRPGTVADDGHDPDSGRPSGWTSRCSVRSISASPLGGLTWGRTEGRPPVHRPRWPTTAPSPSGRAAASTWGGPGPRPCGVRRAGAPPAVPGTRRHHRVDRDLGRSASCSAT